MFNPDILVRSRQMLELEIRCNRITIPSALISIADNANELPLFTPKGMIKDIHSLAFIDLTEPLPGYITYTFTDAIRIFNFVLEIKDKVEQLIVHCEAGVSRSSAVAAAISRYFFGDDSQYFNSNLYLPNKLVYKTTLRAFRKSEPYKQITKF